jgi:hypothetical protein
MILRRILRAAAILIAAAGMVDPAFTRNAPERPLVAIVTLEGPSMDLPADGGTRRVLAGRLAERLTEDLSPFARPVPHAVPGARAYVLIGDGRAPSSLPSESPVYAVSTDSALEPNAAIAGVSAPARVASSATAEVAVDVTQLGLGGRTSVVSLEHRGLTLDRVSHTWSSETSFRARLRFTPSDVGLARVRAVVSTDAPEAALADNAADALIEVGAARLPVLVYDTRPSWSSAFVRRALERDPRFDVTFLSSISRGARVRTGDAPATLADPAILSPFAAVVVGAPELLTAADVSGLERFARVRGGAVVLLPDRPPQGPVLRLIESSSFDEVLRDDSVVMTEDGRLRGSEFAIGTSLPPGAQVLAALPDGRAAIWTRPLGTGQVLYSGVLDGWRYRSGDDFDRAWAAIIGHLASSAPPRLAVSVSRRLVRPGGRADIVVTVRPDALPASAPIRVPPVGAQLMGRTETTNVRVWPSATPGRFEGALSAPAAPGAYRLVARLDEGPGTTTEASTRLLVADDVREPLTTSAGALAAIATAHGGLSVPAAGIDRVAPHLRERLHPQSVPQTTHPMRSAWWIVPFAGCLGGEWWLRRRRGLR